MTDQVRQTRRYVPVVGPKLKKLLFAVFGLFALLAINSVYLSGITFLEWLTKETYQDFFYQYMFLGHLVLGLLLVLPVIFYGAIHISNAHDRPNRRAVKVGYALFTIALILLVSGLVLTRGIPVIEVRHPAGRELTYWAHVLTPLVVGWLFVLHRLAGKRINWRAGAVVAAAAGVFALIAIYFQYQDPRQWNVAGPASGEQYFFPSLARTATGNFIPADALMMDQYCKECHADVHEKWSYSAHRFASFNNPAYLFSVRNTRQAMLERDGTVQGSRFCAGCHDPVPFFSGAFDDPAFDDVNHPTAQAGITCTGCHAITNINTPKGNSDYTIEEPLHYPFTYSGSEFLQWVNRALVKAKPDFHKRTFLKPLHKTPEFCGTCHKVHLPVELNAYKWLRGQDHYDSYHLSGVSGHGVTSFYYPPRAEHNCNGCHLPLQESDDFGTKANDDSGVLTVHDHQFPSANTAIPHLLGLPEWVNEAHRKFLDGVMRVDIVALRRDGTVMGELLTPLRPTVPELEPGKSYLIESVIRTVKMGHLFTQGTADSNEVWLEVTVRSGDTVIGRSGAMDERDGAVDPWSHFVNAFVLDRDGNRIDRRNAEAIFTSLYNNQIPPGAADSVHFRIRIPDWVDEPVEVEIKLNYRKFDTTYVRYFQSDTFQYNDLPVITLATDRIVFPVAGSGRTVNNEKSPIETWQRLNDYGIGLLRKRGTGELRQAEEVFHRVEELGRPDGPLNLARVYIREGRLDEAVAALRRAAEHDPPAYPWSVTYFTGVVNQQNGYLDEAVENFQNLVATRYSDARQREFDFSQDYRLLNKLSQTLFERAKLERGTSGQASRHVYLEQAAQWFSKALEFDPENAEAHYGLAQVYTQLDRIEEAEKHRALHAKYKVDDNARDRAVAIARRNNAAADHAADDIVVYDLQREGAFGLEVPVERIATR